MDAEGKGIVYSASFTTWAENIPPLLERAALKERLAGLDRPILIKPNLVEAMAPPITTPAGLVFALVEYLRTITPAKIIIAEGCGAMDYETRRCFETLGYTRPAAQHQAELRDLNNEELVRLSKKECKRWPEMHLPRIAFETFIISVPVLKAHSLAGVTLTMKNMMGFAPPGHYRHDNTWKKSAFHHNVQAAVADLNRYRTPDFTLLDATVGMAQAHLWGPVCDPPVNRLAASHDPVAIDAYGTGLLKKKWRDIGHIKMVHNELGQADPLEIIEV